MADTSVYVGKISGAATQNIKAPVADPSKKVQNTVKRGKDLRQK